MDDDTCKLVFKVFGRIISIDIRLSILTLTSFFSFFLFFFGLSESLLGVGFEVQSVGEFAIVIDLLLCHGVVVKLKSLQSNDEMVGKLLETSSSECIDLLVTLLTEISIITFKHFTFNEGRQALVDGLFILYLDRNSQEWLFSLTVMGAALANELITLDTSKVILDRVLLFGALDQVFKSVHEGIEKFISIHLLKDIGGVAIPIFE